MLACLPVPAFTHPHVWVDTVTTFEVKDGAIVGMRVDWKFDEFFSSTLLEDYDKNHDNQFDAQELAVLEQKAFKNTAKQNYFTFVKVNGQLVPNPPAEDFTAHVEKKIVYYDFRLPFPKPVDPRADKLTVTYFEDSYYVDIAPAAHDPVHFEGDNSLDCTAKVAEDLTTTIYFGQIHPLTVMVHC
jgi:tRNA threonylcarbamoyladenosine biosynthesis protein TsaE